MVTAADCYRCVSRAFNETESTSAAPGQFFKPEHDIEQLRYAGKSIKDTVCTGKGGKDDYCLDGFEFFLIKVDNSTRGEL
jgi:hypothetical protein